MEWQQKGSTYWVRYVHVELQGFVHGVGAGATASAASAASASAASAASSSAAAVGGGWSSLGAEIRVGDRVRVRPSVTTPKYKWGSVTHRSVGTVIAIDPNRLDVTVNFAEQTRWTGLLSEMQRVHEPAVHYWVFIGFTGFYWFLLGFTG